MKNSSMNKSVLSDNSNELPPEKTSSILSNQSSIKDTTKKYLSLQDYYREIKYSSPSKIYDDQMEFIIYYMINGTLIRPMGIFSGRIYRVFNEINQYVLRRSNGQITWYPYVSTNPALKADYFYIMEHTPAKSKLYNLLITIDGSNFTEIFVYGEMFAGFSFRSGSVELKGHLFMTHMYPEPNVCAVEDVLESDILIEITAGTLIVFICDNKDVVILPGDDCKMRFTTENEQVLEQFQKTQKPFSKIVSSPPSKIAQQSMDSTKQKSPKKKNDSLSELIDMITLQKSTKSLLIIENAFDMQTKHMNMSPKIMKSDKQKSPLKKVSIKKSKESLSSKISGKQMRKSIKQLLKSRKTAASNKHSASPSSKKSKPAKIDSPVRKDDKHRIDSSESLHKNLSSSTIDKTTKNEIKNKEKSPESKEKISPQRKSTSRMVKKRRRRSRERMVKLTRSKLANSMLKSRSLLSNKSSLYPIDSEILNRIVKKVSSMNKDDNIIANETVVKSPFPEIVGEEKSLEKFNETKLMIIQKLIENPSLLSSSSSSREKILRQLIRIIKYLKERNNNEQQSENSKELDTNLKLLQNQLENYERILTNNSSSSSNNINNDQQKQLQILTYSIVESLKILNQIIKNNLKR